MVDKMDWAAAMDSEIFREYMKNELTKQAANKAAQAEAELQAEEEEMTAMEALQTFERDLRASPHKLATFRALKQKFLTDPEYTRKVQPAFVRGVLLLDLD